MKRSILFQLSRHTIALCIAALLAPAPWANAQLAAKAFREKVSGIDFIAYPTGVKEVVTFRGSLPAGDMFAPERNLAIPTLTGEMLDKGTTKQDKFAIAQKLQDIGAVIDFSVGGVMTQFQGKCLRKDLPLVMTLLAEQLRTPAFSAEEFDKLKKQLVGSLQRALESPDYRAEQKFNQVVFPKGHPNYTPPTEELITAIQSAKLEDVKEFHGEYYGPAQATLVAVGDLDPQALKNEVARAFAGWTGGKTVPQVVEAGGKPKDAEEVIPMEDKPNVAVLIGQATGLRYSEPDALALRVGTAALGRGFTGRLMANVRDREGLTYGISANLSGDSIADGEWKIDANFAPELLDKGMASTRRQLEEWYRAGVTVEELERVKSALIGTFKVALATTDGLSSTLLEAIHRGYDPSWLDEYPKRISALTLEEVNGAIKKHLSPEKMTTIKAGSIQPPQTRG